MKRYTSDAASQFEAAMDAQNNPGILVGTSKDERHVLLLVGRVDVTLNEAEARYLAQAILDSAGMLKEPS